MPSSFEPPGITSLAEIDRADVTYEKNVTTIEAVVSPSSQGGWPGENDGYYVHSFDLAAWRREGGPVIQSELTVLRAVVPDTNYFDDIPKHSIQRMRVLISEDATRAVFEKSLPMESADPELQAIALKLQQPVVVPSERFGSLTLDRSINWFEGESEWNGKPVRITFPEINGKPAPEALREAERLWSQQAAWNERIMSYAASELLDTKNEFWLDENETALTTKEFRVRMTLTTISVSEEGEFEFWFDDGDLFWGHAIMVRCDLENGPTDAGIHG